MKKLVKILLVFALVGLLFLAPLGANRQDPPKYPDDRPICHINSVTPVQAQN